MIDKLTKAEADDLNELKRNPAFKLFIMKIVTPLSEGLAKQLENLTVVTQSEGPILAAQQRMLRKIFDELADVIDVK